MNESAKESASDTASAPPAAKRKGGFRRAVMKWLVWYPLLLVVLAGGGLYAAYQQPKLRPYLQPHWHNFIAEIPLLRDTIPAADSAPIHSADSSDVLDSDAADSIGVLDSPNPARFADSSFLQSGAESTAEDFAMAEEDEILADDAPSISIIREEESEGDDGGEEVRRESESDLQSDLQIVARDSDSDSISIAKEMAEMRAEISRLQEAVRAANRAAAPGVEMRIDLIDLRLRADGDTAAAAVALSALQNLSAVDSRWLTSEISRLQNTAPRKEILQTLRKLIQLASQNAAVNSQTANASQLSSDSPAADSSDSFTAKAGAMLADIFNVQRTGNSNFRSDDAREKWRGGRGERLLRRMETMLLTDRRAAYSDALDELAARPPSAGGAAELLGALQKFGAPQYALADWKTK